MKLDRGDDYAMLKEMLYRRLSKILPEDFQFYLNSFKNIAIKTDSNIGNKNTVNILASLDGLDNGNRINDVEKGAENIRNIQDINNVNNLNNNLNQIENYNDINLEELPNLLVIDGGIGQFSTTLKILKQLNLYKKIPFIAIAKGKKRNAGDESFFMPSYLITKLLEKSSLEEIKTYYKNEFEIVKFDYNPKQEYIMFKFAKHSSTLYFFERIRDEAHRFAITSHRIKRSNAIHRSILDDIPDIGEKRKLALLHHFGSVEMIRSTSINDLTQVKGISKNIAATIHDYLAKN